MANIIYRIRCMAMANLLLAYLMNSFESKVHICY